VKFKKSHAYVIVEIGPSSIIRIVTRDGSGWEEVRSNPKGHPQGKVPIWSADGSTYLFSWVYQKR